MGHCRQEGCSVNPGTEFCTFSTGCEEIRQAKASGTLEKPFQITMYAFREDMEKKGCLGVAGSKENPYAFLQKQSSTPKDTFEDPSTCCDPCTQGESSCRYQVRIDGLVDILEGEELTREIDKVTADMAGQGCPEAIEINDLSSNSSI